MRSQGSQRIVNQHRAVKGHKRDGKLLFCGGDLKIVAVWRCIWDHLSSIDLATTCGSNIRDDHYGGLTSTGIVGVTSATVSNRGTCYCGGRTSWPRRFSAARLFGEFQCRGFQVTFVTPAAISCSDPLSQGAITRVSINADPGQYTSTDRRRWFYDPGAPAQVAPIATNDLPQLLVDASMRYDVGFDVEASNDIKAEGVKVLRPALLGSRLQARPMASI